MSGPVHLDSPGLREFWRERHLCTLTTLRADGTPHVVPVGATLDIEAGLLRVTASRTSAKVRHVAAGARRVAVCQVDGARWCTVEGLATVRDDPESVAEAVRRYAERYRAPRPNPERVVLEVTITKVLGSARLRGV
ncbi:pyridoxamine 5'-phosphate oxidase family protein [Couchioplanes caeruleus]|uniref:Acyltransferase n=2 Tax=Couchioplanes caeruleus TaxID=56438 RepID=A0A1K0GIF9_9ACTN|nr:PPOX class F420-dependent oxidoreductase [Couchioplanes caeruleus]OJF12030.1 acyltransferase [Couchioplanes caeruleus subsp. caeruleus]ROP34354.1 PPOX class probable F420-dependent enzyme [Couchioplanes caeruleus]